MLCSNTAMLTQAVEQTKQLSGNIGSVGAFYGYFMAVLMITSSFSLRKTKSSCENVYV